MKTNSVILVNAGSLVGTAAVTASLGFAYWWVAARQFSPKAVGLASAAISVMTLLGTLAILGLGTLLVGELPRQGGKKASLISAALIVVGGVGGCLGAIFAVGVSLTAVWIVGLKRVLLMDLPSYWRTVRYNLVSNSVNGFDISSCELPQDHDAVITHPSQSSLRPVSCDALVLDARLRQSLVTVRSLGSRGLHVAALDSYDGLPVPSFWSHWCHHKFLCHAEEGSMDYLTYLEQVLDSTGARVLIPSSDGTIALLRRFRERLEHRGRHIALAKEPALKIAVNKEQTLAIARRLGVGVPRSVTVTAGSEVGAALHEIGLPSVVKPVESWGGGESRVASRLVTTLDEALRAVEELTGFGGKVLFQPFLSGKRESISFLYANGKIYACFAYWGKRSNPPLGGTSVFRQSIAIPEDIGRQAERLVREIELEGYSHVEFRRDSAGYPYLMEINPRLNAGIELAVRAGVDFPSLLYQWASGERIDVVKGYRIGEQMRYLGGDFATTLATLLQRGRPGVPSPARAILEFCTAFFVPMSYDYLDWSDPLPAWAATTGFPRYLLRRGRKGLSRKRQDR